MKIIGIKYRTNVKNSSQREPIDQVEFTHESDKTVSTYLRYAGGRVVERRELKHSTVSHYWDTYDEARQYLIDLQAHKLERAEQNVIYRRRRLQQANDLPRDPAPFIGTGSR